jgi:hypothetical protein
VVPETVSGETVVGETAAGRVERLWLKPAVRVPLREVSSVDTILRRGLAGNADLGGRRQLTVLSLERWIEATATLGEVDPRLRRANVLVSGIDLETSRGRVLAARRDPAA